MAAAARPPRPSARAGRALPARAPAGGGGPGHRRQGLRVDHRRRHPRRGRRRPRELLRTLRRQARLHARRPQDPDRRPRAAGQRPPTAKPAALAGAGPQRPRRDARLVRRRSGGRPLPDGRAEHRGAGLPRHLPGRIRPLHQAARRRPATRTAPRRSCRRPPGSRSGRSWPGSTRRSCSAAPSELPRLLPDLTYELLVPSSAKRWRAKSSSRAAASPARPGRRPAPRAAASARRRRRPSRRGR